MGQKSVHVKLELTYGLRWATVFTIQRQSVVSVLFESVSDRPVAPLSVLLSVRTCLTVGNAALVILTVRNAALVILTVANAALVILTVGNAALVMLTVRNAALVILTVGNAALVILTVGNAALVISVVPIYSASLF